MVVFGIDSHVEQVYGLLWFLGATQFIRWRDDVSLIKESLKTLSGISYPIFCPGGPEVLLGQVG